MSLVPPARALEAEAPAADPNAGTGPVRAAGLVTALRALSAWAESEASRISPMLTAAAFAFWSLSLFEIHLVPSQWGLIASLPGSYFAALMLLSLASGILWVSRTQAHLLLSVQAVLLVVMLFLTPVLIGGTPITMRNMLALRSLTEFVDREHHLDPVSQYYHNWPGFNLFEFSLLKATGVGDTDLLLLLAPFVMQLLALPLLYLFFLYTVGPSNALWAGPWVFYLGHGSGAFTFSPQPLGLLLFFMFLALLARTMLKGADQTAPRILLLVAAVGAVMSHALTAIAIVFIIAVNYAISRRAFWAIFLVTFAAILAAWSLFFAIFGAQSHVPGIIQNQMFRLDLIFFWNVTMYHQYYRPQELFSPINIKYASYLAFISIGILGFISSWAYRTRLVWLLMVAVACGVVGMVPFSFYSGEFFVRLYVYLLPVIGFFFVQMLRRRALVALGVMFIWAAVPLFLATYYGNYDRENVPASIRSSFRFLKEVTDEGKLLIGEPDFTMGRRSGYELRTFYPLIPRSPYFISDRYDEFFAWTLNLPPRDRPLYVRVDRVLQAEFAVTDQGPGFVPEMKTWLDGAKEFALIYASGNSPTGPATYVAEPHLWQAQR